MSDGDRGGSISRWVRTLIDRIRGGTDDSDNRSGEAGDGSDPRDGLFESREQEKMDDFVDLASEEDADDDGSNG